MNAAETSIHEAWKARGRTLSVHGGEVFSVDEGPTASGGAGTVLVLHGFPTSSLDFHRVIDGWSQTFRVVVHDHPGFGLSAKPADYSYSLLEQAEVAIEVWRQLGVRSGHLLAHDYGTSVATELLARRERGLLPIELESVTMSNGSVYLELARLRLSQRIARSKALGPLFGRLVGRGYFKRVMRRLWGDPRRARESDLDALWDGVAHGVGNRRVHQISSYLDERVRFRHRWIGASSRLDLPAHVLWGRRDPIAVPQIAERLASDIPNADLTWLDDLGHYPMLEDPESYGEAALGFWGRLSDRQTA